MAELASTDRVSSFSSTTSIRKNSLIGRRRTKTACAPCKERKRKCNGKLPCSTCLRYEYQCRYNTILSKLPPTSHDSMDESIDKAVSTGSAITGAAATTAGAIAESVTRGMQAFSIAEATSGVAFSLAVGVNHEVTQVSDTIAWNIAPLSLNPPGLKQSTLRAVSVPSLVVEQQVLEEVQKYVFSVGNSYPMISLETAVKLVRDRYLLSEQHLHPLLDAILSTMIALSHTFTGRHCNDLCIRFAMNSKLCFELCFDEEPTDLLIFARGLQTLLLRATDSAHACWMASCVAIHLMDAMPTFSSQKQQETQISDEERRSLYWTSRLMHMWISFEFGRPHILTTSATADDASLATSVQKHKSSMLGLFTPTLMISPSKAAGYEQLERSFDSIEAFDCSGNDAVSLSRCILAMTTFRRRLIQHPPVPPTLKARMMAIGREGLHSVERLLQASEPWWHLANLPLQFVCLALLLNALVEVPFAIRVLRAVDAVYPTDRVKGTIAYTERILSAVHRQKLAECRLLENVLGLESHQGNPCAATSDIITQDIFSDSREWHSPAALGDLNWEMPLNMGIPTFDQNMTW